jgi:hypothetical protein
VAGETAWLIASASGGPKGGRPQGCDLLLQQLVGHGDLPELGLEAEQLLVAAVALALLHRRLRRDQGAVAPRAQAGDGDVELAGQGLERLAAQQAGDDGELAPRGEAALRPGTARGGAGVSILGARWRPLGLVAAALIHGFDLRLR